MAKVRSMAASMMGGGKEAATAEAGREAVEGLRRWARKGKGKCGARRKARRVVKRIRDLKVRIRTLPT